MTFEARNLTLADYLREWIGVKKNAIRTNTALQYERLIRLYIGPGLGMIKLKDLGLHAVNHFYERLVSRGIGVSNIRHTHRILHSALAQAVKSGAIARNVSDGATVPNSAHKEMATLGEQEVGRLLVAASGSRYRSLYHLAVVTGMRFSELRGLSWDDVDWIQGTITVKRQIQDILGQGRVTAVPKTHSGTRTILLGESTLSELRDHKRRIEDEAQGSRTWHENDLLFPSTVGTPFAMKQLHQDFARILAAANLRRIRFHDLRHTAASLMLNHGIPPLVVSRILGHANASVTLTVYAHSNVDMQCEAVKIMGQIVNPIPISTEELSGSIVALQEGDTRER
jgi:integrase